MILSALLSLAMLFASCSSGTDTEEEATKADTGVSEETDEVNETESGTETETETEQATEAPEPIPQDEVIDYAAIISKWKEYLDFAPPAAADRLSATELFKTGVNDQTAFGGNKVTTTATVYGKLALCSIVTEGYTTDFTTGVPKATRYVQQKIYNMETGQIIMNLSISGYFVENSATADSYTVTFPQDYANANYLGIAKIVYADYDMNKLDENGLPAPGYNYTYRYIDASGETLYEGKEDVVCEVVSSQGNVSIVDFDGKLYACTDGEIFYTFAEGENLRQIVYLPYEYKGNRYYVDNDRVQIADENYNLVANAEISSTIDLTQATLLGNGNVLLIGEIAAEENADFENVQVYTAIVDATTGELREIDTDFAITNIITDFDAKDGITLKEGNYAYAEIKRFADGKLSSDVESVILDESLSIVATLPDIVKNQTSIVRVLGNGDLLVRGTGANDTLYYSIDLDAIANAASLYANYEDVQFIKNGFIADGTVYSCDMSELADLYEDYNSYTVTEYGTVVLYYTDEFGNSSMKVAHIDDYGYLLIVSIGESVGEVPFSGWNYFVGTNGVYDVYGNQLIYRDSGEDVNVSSTSDTCMFARVVRQNGTQVYYIIK